MPRFSDIFVYETREMQSVNTIIYKSCYMLKDLGKYTIGEHIEGVIFDVDGMVLLVQHKGQMSGPHCLTV